LLTSPPVPGSQAALLAQQQHQLAQLRTLYNQLQEQAHQQALVVAGGAGAASAYASPLGAHGGLGAPAPPPAGVPPQYELPAHFQLQGMGTPAAPPPAQPPAAAAAAAAAAREASHVAMAAHQHAQLAQLQRQVAAAMAAHQQAAFSAPAPSLVATTPPHVLTIAPLGTAAGGAGTALAAAGAPETGGARTPARRRLSASLEAAPPAAAEKRPPTAYNEFVADEFRRLRAEDPAIASREAFALAAQAVSNGSGPAAAFGVHAGVGAPTPAAAHPAAAASEGLTPDPAPGGPALRGR
jgi:hypothetical protein